MSDETQKIITLLAGVARRADTVPGCPARRALLVAAPCRFNSPFRFVCRIRGPAARAGNVILPRPVASNFGAAAMIVDSGSTSGLLPAQGMWVLFDWSGRDRGPPMGHEASKARMIATRPARRR